MREIGEIIFDFIYLCGVIALGITMIRQAPKGLYRLFGIMAVVLGLGDAFHLVPRMYALATTGSVAGFVVPLGIGKWITSITMTVFYVILYEIWRKRYAVTGLTQWTCLVYLLAACRIILCFFPTKSVAYGSTGRILGNLPQYSLCAARTSRHRFIFPFCMASRPFVPLALADYCHQLCHVYSRRSLVSQHPKHRTADDS